MTRTQIISTIEKITPAEEAAKNAARQRQDSLAKPPGSLGGLEQIAIRMAGITGEVIPGKQSSAGGSAESKPAQTAASGGSAESDAFPGQGCVIVFCADNGVVAQGVASAPQSVTRAQTINFTRRLTGVGALAKSYGSELLIVDMGVKDPIPKELYDSVPLRDTHRIIDRRIRPGTWDIAEGPAMTEEEVLQAMSAGVEMASAAATAGFGILGIGEMGIGNTTTSAAVLSVITNATAEQTCGRGGGVNARGFQRKKEIVEAIRMERNGTRASEQKCPSPISDAASETEQLSAHARLDGIVRILARCGGFDLAAMTGAYLGAAAAKIPVVIDGYISVVAALAAAEIAPAAADYMFASHASTEPGYALAVQRLAEYSPGLKPFLALDMRLGEGSGCPIAFDIIRGACDVMRTMATFAEAEINDDYLEEVRAGGCF